MKKLLYACLCAGAMSAQAQAPEPVGNRLTEFSATITHADLRKHLSILASDAYEGRDTGSKGQKMAAEYIQNHFKAIGLAGPVKGSPNPYFQPVPLVRKQWGMAQIAVKKNTFEHLKDFIAYGDFSLEDKKLSLVYAGYGIDHEKYSDYKNLDVKGKAVVVLTDEPKDKAGKYLISGSDKKSEQGALNNKVSVAQAKGAKLLILVTASDEAFKSNLNMMRGFLQGGSLAVKGEGKAEAKTGIVIVSPSTAAALLNTSPEQFKALAAQINEQQQSNAGQLTSKVKSKLKREAVDIGTENVLGYMEGTDKKDELLVVTAHYDHVGINDGKIYNGADDDGSGTVSVMEIAEAFAKAKQAGNGPRRSVLFMTVTGEERGLLGSDYYSSNPVFPLDKTVTNLNIDMVGRVDDAHKDNPNYIYVIGSNMLSSDLHQLSEQTAKTYAPNVLLDYKYNSKDDPNRFYYRSDHYNFAKHGIPVIFYFNGTHEDYHQPGDDVEKINFDAMEKRARLVFATAWEIANREQKPVVDKKE